MSSAPAATAATTTGGTTTAQTATTTTTTPTATTTPAATTTSNTISSILSTLTTSTSSVSTSDASESMSLAESSSESSQTTIPPPAATQDSNPAPIPSSKVNEHLARNICLSIFLLFTVVALIGLAYWGIPRFMQRRRERKAKRDRDRPFPNEDTVEANGTHRRSDILMPEYNTSIVSFDSRSPAEKSKSTDASPASLAFSPPISPKSPAPWTHHKHSNSTTQNLVPAALPPQRPASRPPPLELEDVPRSVFYNHVCPSTTTIGSYPYEDEDSSHWAYVPPLSSRGNSRPSTPPVAHVRDTARRDSDTYPRTPYM